MTGIISVYSRHLWGRNLPQKFENPPPKKKILTEYCNKVGKYGKIIKIVAFRCVS